MRRFLILLSVSMLTSLMFACQLGTSRGENVITVYSERHYDVDRDLYARFEDMTGYTIDLVRANADPLINRLADEGEDSPADVLIIADVGRLERAKDMGLLQSIESEFLTDTIPSNYRDEEHFWFGLTKRARVLVYHPDRVDVNELSTYEALTEPQFKGRIVTRTSTNIYNQSMMASFIAIMGEAEAHDFAQGLVNNFARNPEGNDRDQAKAVVAGIADIAIMNTYYIGRMLYSSDPEEVAVAEAVRIFFPNQETTGTHVNISAAGVTKHAKNVEGAIKLIEFLVSEEAQEVYASANFEYPINPNVDAHPLLQSWGTFRAQDIVLSDLGKYSNRAKMIMDEVDWK